MGCYLMGLRDPQDVEPRAYCRICKAELYEYDEGDLCERCKEDDDEDL